MKDAVNERPALMPGRSRAWHYGCRNPPRGGSLSHNYRLLQSRCFLNCTSQLIALG